MKAVGIVVEYNPFHNGHLYHAKMAREQTNADVVIAVMSASFLQRGEPAIVPKWERTQMALAHGVDIVVELPYIYSTQKAEIFARGAVSILAAVGADSINFGSESGEIDAFIQLVQTMKENETLYNQFLKEQMTKGFSYPRASAEAFKRLQLDSSILSLQEPNNILGYHYVKAIIDERLPLKATTTLRKQAHFHDQSLSNSSIASATSIRKALNDVQEIDQLAHVVPSTTVTLLQNYIKEHALLHTWEHYFPFLQYKIISSTPEQLRQIYECEEGLEYRAIEMMNTSSSFQHWMEKMKTKRYTWTRLQRFATHMLTNTTKDECAECLSNNDLPYVRLLGMTAQGRAFLNKTKKERDMPLITRMAAMNGRMAELENRATNIYFSPFQTNARIIQIQKEINRIPVMLNN